MEDVANGKSEIGVIYLSEHNEEVLTKLIKNNQLVFEQLYVAKPHVFICKGHPLADRDVITMEDLEPYPYLVYEQGNRNSFYFSEEFISMLDFPKIIQVRDRATLFNLVIGLNGFTVSSGVIDHKLNGSGIIAKPLLVDNAHRCGAKGKYYFQPVCQNLYGSIEKLSVHRLKLWISCSFMYFIKKIIDDTISSS